MPYYRAVGTLPVLLALTPDGQEWLTSLLDSFITADTDLVENWVAP
jgi:hypothetical protein